ncbi:MAG TPA: hypothetical protein VF837_05520 [Patescibacteria group bacterium]
MMPDDNQPVSVGTNPQAPTSSSVEADFPTLKNEPASTPAPVNLIPPTPPTPSTPTATIPPSTTTTPTPATPNLPNPQSPPAPIFTPLGGNPIDLPKPGGLPQLVNLQYSSRPSKPETFETLEKSVMDIPKPEGKAPITSNLFPDIVPQTEKPANPLILTITLIIVFLIIAGIFGAVYAVAYGVIDINNPSVSAPISNFVQSLPFTPKTPQYLIVSAVKAQEKIKKESFDISMAMRSNSLQNVFGSSTAEVAAKGSVDYSDLKNIKFTTNVSITKDFNADIRSVDSKVYFKINKLPMTLLAFAGLTDSDTNSLIADWVSYDTSSLGTEASKVLDQKSNGATQESFSDKIQGIFFNEQVLKNITVTDDKIAKTNTYKLVLNADADTIDYLDKAINQEFNPTATIGQTKASDVINNLVVDMWVEKNTYYLRKISVSFTAISGTDTQKTSSDIAFTYSLSDLNADFSVDIPQSSIPMDKFILRIEQLIQSKQQTSSGQSTMPASAINMSTLLSAPTPNP